MKKKLPIIIGIVIGIIIILLVIITNVTDDSITVKLHGKYYDQFAEKALKPLSDFNLEYKTEDEYVILYNSEYRIAYNFKKKKISGIDIDIDLDKNTLSGEETVKKIEEIYMVVVNGFDSIHEYLGDDFFITDEYSLNKYDREHLVNILDYNEKCSSWSTYYTYSKDYDSVSVSYSLYESYSKEGFSAFYISIY